MSGGWSVCGLCGVVVADIPGHVYWHETGALELDTEIIEKLQQTPKSDAGESTRTDESETTDSTTTPSEGEE